MKLIRYSSSYDQSGYGIAATNTCYALIKSGLNISTNLITTSMSRIDKAESIAQQEIIKRITDKKATVNICEQIPNLWSHAFQKDSRNIGRIFWEADRVSKSWTDTINSSCDELWVSCESNKEACENSGVKKPIYVIPAISNCEVMSKEESFQHLTLPGDKDTYRFYSIAQWTKRKNLDGLLRAFYNEFSGKDNVMLVLKTYGTGITNFEKRIIKEFILETKVKSGNPDPAPIYFLGDLLTPNQLSAIHAQSHCLVSPNRGEGWNIPLCDALSYGNQAITTRLGGIADKTDDSSVYVVPHTLETLNGMPWSQFYDESMNWGAIKDEDIQEQMRKAYNERHDFSARFSKYADILDYCSEEKVVVLIRKRLEQIC